MNRIYGWQKVGYLSNDTDKYLNLYVTGHYKYSTITENGIRIRINKDRNRELYTDDIVDINGIGKYTVNIQNELSLLGLNDNVILVG